MRLLTLTDLPALLEFERRNRAFFEQWVPPRPAWFFSDQSAYESHMRGLLEEQEAGAFLMYVCTGRQQSILGRLNITIGGTISLGYRVAQACSGEGLASQMVQQASGIARDTLKASCLTAQAAQNNPASQRVLTKSGFTLGKADPEPTTLNGQTIWLERFHKRL